MPNTQSREVNLTKRVQTPKGMRYCPVVLSPNGRIKSDLVLVNCKPEKHSEGAYYLEWREKRKRIRLSVRKDPQEAAAHRQRKEAELNALNNGMPVMPEPAMGTLRSQPQSPGFLKKLNLPRSRKPLPPTIPR